MDTICQKYGYRESRYNRIDPGVSRFWDPPTQQLKDIIDNDQPCPSSKSNPRGSYTANLIPCNFTFHTIPEKESLHPMELSTQCHASNRDSTILLFQDYVFQWPDECVGDFSRCYSIQRDVKIFAQRFCNKDWIIPEGVTHIAVDCSMDKATKVKKAKLVLERMERNQAQIKQDEERFNRFFDLILNDFYQLVGLLLIGGTLVLLLSVVATYNMIVRPMLRQCRKEKVEDGGWTARARANSNGTNSSGPLYQSSTSLDLLRSRGDRKK